MFLNSTWYLNRRCGLKAVLAEWVSVACVVQKVRYNCRMMLLTLIPKNLFCSIASSETYSTPLFCRISQIRLVLLHPTSFKKADSSTDCALKGVFMCFLYIGQLPWLVIVSITQFTIYWAIFEKIHLLQSMSRCIWACAHACMPADSGTKPCTLVCASVPNIPF